MPEPADSSPAATPAPSLQALAARSAADPAAAAAEARRTVHEGRERDRGIGAFTAWLDADVAAAQAAALASGGGPLAGLCVGVKDIFDTRDLPTAYGSPTIYAPAPARQDAAIVARLRRAGALVVGKTTTTEFAYLHPTATRNPAADGRTPGGSSAGSAAAVAAGLVPLAVGTQTGGSVIRPASYCGVVGYKPSFGWLPTPGLKCFSWSLDTVGLLTRKVHDMAWAAQALSGRALCDAAPHLDSGLARRAIAIGLPLAHPWGEASPGMLQAVQRAAAALQQAGFELRALALPPIAAAAFEAHATVQDWEVAAALQHEFSNHREQLSPILRDALQAAQGIPPQAYERAQALAAEARAAFEAWMQAQGLQLLLTPSAPAEAPLLAQGSTGSSSFNRLWSLLGWPCVSVPGCRGEGGAPVGVQLVGRFGADALTLAVAAELEATLACGA